MFGNVVEHRQSCRRRNGIAAQSRRARSRVSVGDFFRGDERAYRLTVAESFCHAHDVGRHVEIFNREHFARASESRLNFVGNQQRTVFAENFFDSFEVTFRRHDNARVALNRFGNERGNFSRSRRLNNRFDFVRAGKVASRGIFS